jgi:hypothetical protein
MQRVRTARPAPATLIQAAIASILYIGTVPAAGCLKYASGLRCEKIRHSSRSRGVSDLWVKSLLFMTKS